MTTQTTTPSHNLDPAVERALLISRTLNILGVLGVVGVLTGSLFIQFGLGEQPCPLCLLQRSGMIAIAMGPVLNLLYGIRVRHYALSILGGVAAGFASDRQILLHIVPPDAGYGGTVFGWHLYTWAAVTYLIAITACAFLLMWSKQFEAHDTGILKSKGAIRTIGIIAIAILFIYTVIIFLSAIPECGLGMCPDDPPNLTPLF